MSRRKQEKPQPRKNLVKGESSDLVQDILTCGACQKDFPLCDIVRFIQHKAHTCNKENCRQLLFANDSDGEDLASLAIPLVAQRLTPPSSNGEKEETFGDDFIVSSSSLKNTLAKDKATSVKDLTGLEPCSYVCSTCKQSHTSAWALLQHVQNQHGLKIYVDPSPTQSPPSATSTEKIELISSTERSPASALRVPLLERQLEPTPLFPRPSSQELHLDLVGLSSASNHLIPAPSSPPPLLEAPQLDTSSHPASTLGLSYEPQLDFYSQRLRELAGATSPNASVSPSKLLQPSFKAIVNSTPSQKATSPTESPKQTIASTPPKQISPQAPQSSASSTTSEQAPSSPKLNPKSCEFCGKSFRFQSNLVVHRRSHTGEKPFKCHICNHACTQASKLKRHMKTHKGKKKRRRFTSDTPLALDTASSKNGELCSEESGRSTPNLKNKGEAHTNGDNEYMSDDQEGLENTEEDFDEEEEIDVEEEDIEDDEEEEEEIDADGEEEMDEFEKKIGDRDGEDNMVAEDLTKKRLNNGTENGEVVKSEKPEKKVRHSLLSEVMEKIGLAHIQQYNEAYKQALKESSVSGNMKQERHSDGSASNDDLSGYDDRPERPAREGTRSAGQSPLSFGPGLLSAFDQSLGIKRIRLDDHWRDKERENNLYAGLWIPSVSHSVSSYKDLYGADGHDRRKSSTESALNNLSPSGGRLGSSSPRPGPSSSLCSLGSIANSLLKPKDQRRNDTCEFCGKVFKNCSNLTVHRRSHTGEKPYKCELCSYACAQSSKLTRHMKTHGRLGKDVYRCRFCDMPFSVPSTLEKHMRKCVVSQSGGSYLLSERDSDSKEMTS